MTLFTPRLMLRNYQQEDWERVHIYGSNPLFSKYEAWGPNTIEDTHRFIEDMMNLAIENPRTKFELAVCLKDSGILIGGCGIRVEKNNVAGMGWAINSEFQNQGYATEAARNVMEFGFNTLNLDKVYATCDTRNAASFKVMEKIGMKRVAHLIKDKHIKGYLRDSYRYEITKSEM